MGYNNFLDIDAALNCLNEFSENACVIIKHNNPCGVALGDSPLRAFQKALNCDQKSAFGGVVAFNRKIDEKLARALSKYFFEIIIGKNFTENSKKVPQFTKYLNSGNKCPTFFEILILGCVEIVDMDILKV